MLAQKTLDIGLALAEAQVQLRVIDIVNCTAADAPPNVIGPVVQAADTGHGSRCRLRTGADKVTLFVFQGIKEDKADRFEKGAFPCAVMPYDGVDTRRKANLALVVALYILQFNRLNQHRAPICLPVRWPPS